MSNKGSRFYRPKSRFMPAHPVSSKSFTRNPYRDPRYTSLDDDVLYTPYRPHIHHHYDPHPEELYSQAQVNRELFLSSAAIEDSYDITNRSRNRDKDVLAAANKAINRPPVMPAVDRSRRGVGESTKRALPRRSHSTPRSLSVPPRWSTPAPPSTSTALALPPPPLPSSGLTASPGVERNSPYLNYAKTLDTAKAIRDDTYEPLYSETFRTPASPMRDLSPYRSMSPYGSPSRSGTQTPVGEFSSGYNRLSRKRHKPRVLASKRHVGNYYNRLLSKRSADKSGKEGKYWPYLDVEDIESEDVGDLFSDSESPERSHDKVNTYYITGLGDDSSDNKPVTYSYGNYGTYDEPDIPEYVPFRPKPREISPERDYSSASIIPYLPKRDSGGSSVSDDIAFNTIVAASAARARKALECINWKNYDQASLVLSVEGEYRPSAEDHALAFRYISRPLQIKAPERHTPTVQTVAVQDSDTSFNKYLSDLQTFREGIRKRLEDGYKALSTASNAYYTPAAISYSSHTPSATHRPISKPYVSRLGERTNYKYGRSLELYPLSSSSRRSGPLALPYSSDALPQSRALMLFDSKYDSTDSKLSTFAKVQIKVDTTLHSSPRAAVASRRVLRGRSVPPTPVAAVKRVSFSEVDLGLARASPYILRYPVPPASVEKREGRYPRVTIIPRFRHAVPVKAVRFVNVKHAREPSSEFDTEGLGRAPLSLLAYLRNLDNKLKNKRILYHHSYAPNRSTSKKAALIGSKVDVVTPERRRPKSVYGQASLKKVEAKADEAKSQSPQPPVVTGGLHAHKPVSTPPLQTKVFHHEDVERHPALSWKHRIDAYSPPDDYVFVPRSLDSVRACVLDAKDKVDRHKQLMDRHLWEPGLSAADRKVLMSVKNRASRAVPSSNVTVDTAYKGAMNPVRRKARRILALTGKPRQTDDDE